MVGFQVLMLLCSNTFPHSTFNWVGIDGTQVLCHMTPVGQWHLHILLLVMKFSSLLCVDTYTAQASIGDVNKGVTNHKVSSCARTSGLY